VARAKIFCIGLSKTGTTTLEAMLNGWGLPCVSMPISLRQIRRHAAASDISVALNFQRLDRLFPRARFVYSVRRLDAWLESCREMWARRRGFFAADRSLTLYNEAAYGTRDFDAALFAAAYRRHDAAVRAYFAERPGDLLQLDVAEAPQDAARFAAFVDRPPPAEGFPRVNAKSDIEAIALAAARGYADTALAAQALFLEHDWLEALLRRRTDAPPVRLGIGWEVDLMLRGLLDREGAPAPVAALLDLPETEVRDWMARSGYGRRGSLADWLYYGVATRLKLPLGPRSAVLE
jgi:hypothetical protein